MAAKNAAAADAAKTDGLTQADKNIAGGYASAGTKVAALIALLGGLEGDLRAQGTEVGEVAEARRREQDKATYDMAQERQAVVDRQKAEDAERAANHKARETALRDAETDLLDTLGVKRDPEGKVPVVRTIRDALDAKVAAAADKARNEGVGIAKKDADAAKKLADAEAAADKKIKESEVATLRARVAELEKVNADLLAAQKDQLAGYERVATGALQASAGIQGKATDSLQSAATAGNGQGARARG